MHIILFAFAFCSKKIIKAVAAEKAHNDLISGVEHFDKATMKHTETEEKNALPPVEGLSAYSFGCAFECLFF